MSWLSTKNSQDFENIQFPTLHLEAKNPFGLVSITFLIWLSGTIAAFDAAKAKWDRDPQQYASKSYCSARQELSVLIHLKHTNIVPLIGICVNPLAIVLELAPLGALDTQLKVS